MRPTMRPDSLLPFLAAASIKGRVALGPDAGQEIERCRQPARGAPSFEPGQLCTAEGGFSLHARVRVEADDRERLCRYGARPAISTKRLSLSPEGKVVYELRRPWRDGTTHFLFDPLTFIERLAALIPGPREHQLTRHGVLAPASSWRESILPAAPAADDAHAAPISCAPEAAAHDANVAQASSRAPVPLDRSPSETITEARAGTAHRYRWAELMRRVFGLDVLRCPQCGGRRKLIALLTDSFIA